jgi:hypothetical protein
MVRMGIAVWCAVMDAKGMVKPQVNPQSKI